MLQSSTRDPSDQLIAFVRAWFDLLAQGNFAEACAQLDTPNSHGVNWTPALLQTVVTDSFGPATRFATKHPEGPNFTSAKSASGEATVSHGAFEDGSGYWIDHAVPLNGAWSDLTAQFEFIREPGGYRVVLHDLHVL